MLDYRIDTFLTLCETMNYRKAAEQLHISQPAVTQQIHSLEQLYGHRLFLYENRKIQKTRAAVVLEQYARTARLQNRALMERLEQPEQYSVRVGATKTIGDYDIRQQLLQYLSNKDNTLTLIVDNTEHLLRQLEENNLDFAVVEGAFDKSRFDSYLLKRVPFVGICRKDHPFAGQQVTIEQLLGQTIIHREDGSGNRAILEQMLGNYNESLERFARRICISSFKLILELVKEGYGVSFVYNILADSDPSLAKFTLKGESVVREFNIVYLKNADVDDKITALFGQLPVES